MTPQKTPPRTAEAYAELPYRISLVPDRSKYGTRGWFAEVEELPGAMSQGRTPDEAVERVRDAMLGWISVALEDGKEIPLPREWRQVDASPPIATSELREPAMSGPGRKRASR